LVRGEPDEDEEVAHHGERARLRRAGDEREIRPDIDIDRLQIVGDVAGVEVRAELREGPQLFAHVHHHAGIPRPADRGAHP
jgi:hypothetical protein